MQWSKRGEYQGRGTTQEQGKLFWITFRIILVFVVCSLCSFTTNTTLHHTLDVLPSVCSQLPSKISETLHFLSVDVL